LQAKGVPATLAEVAAEMAERDARDSARGVAPLRPAEDATLLDTSAMDAEAAFQAALAVIKSASA
jgi:cytidylate kinase